MLTLTLVMAGGAVGAVCRFLVDRAVTRRRSGPLPWGTFVVNVTGSLLLGLVAGAGAGTLPTWVGGLVGTGFCGAFTTYSTFGHETVRLATSGGARVRDGGAGDGGAGGPLLALVNVVGTLIVGIGAAAAGWLLATR